MHLQGNQLPQNQEKPEQFKSFDVLASIDLLRFDLQTSDKISPETWNRVRDEEMSYIAEGINRPLHTEFVLHEENGTLVYFHEGQWKPYMSTLFKGLETAVHEKAIDSRRAFMADRAAYDLQIGYQLLGLSPGQKLVWHSSFPHEAHKQFGDKFISDLGFWPSRKMGFIYQAQKNSDESLLLSTQSVDGSDEDGFRAALERANDKQFSIEDLRNAYDEVMENKYAHKFYAGRRIDSELPEQNAWEAIAQHDDLLQYYFTNLESLARQNGSRAELDKSKKRLTYGVWAAIKERLSVAARSSNYRDVTKNIEYNPRSLDNEINQAYRLLSARGEILFGCGGSITGEDALLEGEAKDVFESIFGSKDETLKCVTCPLCKEEGVDAHVHRDDASKTKTITCSKCKQSKSYSL
ncbi:MAG TPA: hypothetical protein VLF90_02015 [Patescibacteria group bacterium]|nr:hypothetical protein [Patescibacteria group bacterium]